MSRRYVLTCLLVLSMGSVAACGGSTEEESSTSNNSGPQPVSVDFQVPSGGDVYRARLSGAVSGEVTGKSGSVNFRRQSDDVEVELAASKFTASANYRIQEGQTGTFTSVKTPQLVYEGTRYVAKEKPIVITIETFSNNTFEATLVGTFGYTRSSGTDQKLDEPVRLEAKMSFEYTRRQPRTK